VEEAIGLWSSQIYSLSADGAKRGSDEDVKAKLPEAKKSVG